MKKLLLVAMILSFGLYTFAQERAVTSKELRKVMVQKTHSKAVKGTEGSNPNANVIPGSNKGTMFEEETIGGSFYDLSTNTMTQNRLFMHPDGTMGAVWTLGYSSASYDEFRGTGYNYFDGTSWGPSPTERIEDEWSGWPSYVPLGENGEIIANHSLYDGIIVLSRENKGTGDWDKQIVAGPAGALDISWPRLVTSGPDNDIVHMISVTYVAYAGQEAALLYARSSDGGDTWDFTNQEFEDLNADHYTEVSGDAYSFAEPRNGTVAFIVGDEFMDLVLMKSTDDGDTWEKTVIWEHPYPMWDWNVAHPDTFYCNDGGASVQLDSEGKAHVTFGISRILHDEVGTSFSYFPFVDGVAYWNEDMPTFSNDLYALSPYGDATSELVEDYNLIGWVQDVDGNGTVDLLDEVLSYRTLGLSTMTNITVDEFDQVFMAFASPTEGFDNGTYNYRHVWLRGSPDGGASWGQFLDLNSGLIHIFDECVYPIWSPTSSEFDAYLYYQLDGEPGTALDGDHDYHDNFMTFIDIDKSELITTGIEESKLNLRKDNVSQNFPNPFNDLSTVYVVLDEKTDLSMDVHNIMGQVVYSIPEQTYNAGKQEMIINAKNLESGVYFYTVRSGETAVTHKMIVE
jgi:hypothetical protein